MAQIQHFPGCNGLYLCRQALEMTNSLTPSHCRCTTFFTASPTSFQRRLSSATTSDADVMPGMEAFTRSLFSLVQRRYAVIGFSGAPGSRSSLFLLFADEVVFVDVAIGPAEEIEAVRRSCGRTEGMMEASVLKASAADSSAVTSWAPATFALCRTSAVMAFEVEEIFERRLRCGQRWSRC